MNVTRPYWWQVDIESDNVIYYYYHYYFFFESDNGLVPSGNKPLPEPKVNNIYVAVYGMSRPQWVNSLGPSDAIRWQRSGSTLAQVMACCLTAPSHYLNQRWLIISGIHWDSSEGNFTKDTYLGHHSLKWAWKLHTYIFFYKSPREQWVKQWMHQSDWGWMKLRVRIQQHIIKY